MNQPELSFGDDAILIDGYPFRPGLDGALLRIGVREIVEVDMARCVVRTSDELIYLPGWPTASLQEFCGRHALPVRPRYHVWADILDPYVDTSFTAQQVEARNRRLQAAGFGRERVRRLRWLVSVPIFLYQGVAGEWTGLDASDLMESIQFLRLSGLYGAAYRAIMRIALEAYGAG